MKPVTFKDFPYAGEEPVEIVIEEAAPAALPVESEEDRVRAMAASDILWKRRPLRVAVLAALQHIGELRVQALNFEAYAAVSPTGRAAADWLAAR